MPTKGTLLGQKKKMRNGMECEVIADYGWDNITVQFEDGCIREHIMRRAFKTGTIKNPNLKGLNPKHSLVGTTKQMNCGMKCTVIADRGAFDIDVKFEDGTIVTNKHRSAFRSGAIANPKLGKYYSMTKNTRIVGQTLIMNCGMKCTVIEDRGSKDIDVQFEDGTIVTGITRTLFREKNVSNPSLGKFYALSYKTSIVGQTRTMNCGMECTVIEDRGSDDITVQFADGTIVDSRRDSFRYGLIGNHNYDPTSILGEKRRMNCGQMCEVIEDKGSQNITVKFEDGYIRFNCTRHNFLRGAINNPNIATSQSLPQTIVFYYVKNHFPDAISNYRPDWLKNEDTNQNLEIDIWIPSIKTGIEYDGYRWHSVETDLSRRKSELFVESQEINSIITILERGAIVHKSNKHINYQLDYVSSDSFSSNRGSEYRLLLGQLETVIQSMLHDLGIECEVSIDDELIDKLYFEPRLSVPISIGKKKIIRKGDLAYLKTDECNLLGLSSEMNCGMECTVIEDKGFNDLTVQFEDGTIVDNIRRTVFIKQMIRNPNIDNPDIAKESIIGQTRTMNCGMECTVIDDYGYDDISVLFVDGTIVRHRNRTEFRNGIIRNPNIKIVKPEYSMVGETNTMNCGMECTVIEDRGAFDIDVQFTDGTVVKHKFRSAFRSGQISNPKLGNHYTITKNTSIVGKKLTMNCGMECIVIEDRGSKDIDVQFSDGTIVTNVTRNLFKYKNISNPSLGKHYARIKNASIVGQTRTMNCGMECTVIEDRGSNDITVKFVDGTIVKSRRDSFRHGLIGNHNYDPTSILGLELKMNNGELAKVIEDNGCEDITVQFEDGTIVKNIARANFRKGKVRKKKQ